MGCEVVVEGASAAALVRVRALFEEREAVFSRFLPESELNAVNAGRGTRFVTPLFARMVEAALQAVIRRPASSTRRWVRRSRRQATTATSSSATRVTTRSLPAP